MFASALSWTAIGGSITVFVGLLTALINHRVARMGAHDARTAKVATDDAPVARFLLPARSHFVNRTSELQDAAARIGDGEIVLTIEGEVGIGKSAVATELAHRLRSHGSAMYGAPDLRDHTFLWIDGRNDRLSLTDICRPLSTLTGNQSLSVVAEEEKLDALRTHLASNKTVLVLDNLRLADDPDSEAVREFVHAIPSGSLVIASVNRPGSLNGARVSVGELKPLDALRLIMHEVDRLGLGGTELFDEAFAMRLLSIVGGNPGMIEWFLRALSRSSQSLEERLTALERGEGLEDLLAPIWKDLTNGSKTVLGACAHLRGQATAEQLGIACDLAEDHVLSALDELIGVGLVATVRVSDGPNVFTCAHAVQRFILAQTTDTALASFTQLLADHYVSYFGSHWDDARGAIAHLGAFRAVLDDLFARGNDRDLQALFRVTLDIFITLGLFDDRISSGALAYESAIRVDNYRAASLASAILSSTHTLRGEMAEANEALALGLLAAEHSRCPGEIARQMRETGFLRYRSKRPEHALEAIEGADERARAAGDLNDLVDILGLRMSAYLYLGALDEAEAVARNYQQLCNEIPWERAKSNPMRHLAEIAIVRGETKAAQALLDRARTVALEYEDRRALARIHLTEARLMLLDRRPGAARREASQAASQAAALGLPAEVREALALRRAGMRATILPPLSLYYAWRRPSRLTDSPVGGD